MAIDFEEIKKILRNTLCDDEEIEKIKSMSEDDIIKIGEAYEYILYDVEIEKIKIEIYKGEYPGIFYNLKNIYLEYHPDENEVNDNKLIKFMQNPDCENKVCDAVYDFINDSGLLDDIIDYCREKTAFDFGLSEQIIQTILYYLGK